MIPKVDATAYWNDRGEVRQITRLGGFCFTDAGYDRVPAKYSDATSETFCQPKVDDLYPTELEASQAAVRYCLIRLGQLKEKIDELTNSIDTLDLTAENQRKADEGKYYESNEGCRERLMKRMVGEFESGIMKEHNAKYEN